MNLQNQPLSVFKKQNPTIDERFCWGKNLGRYLGSVDSLSPVTTFEVVWAELFHPLNLGNPSVKLENNVAT